MSSPEGRVQRIELRKGFSLEGGGVKWIFYGGVVGGEWVLWLPERMLREIFKAAYLFKEDCTMKDTIYTN